MEILHKNPSPSGNRIRPVKGAPNPWTSVIPQAGYRGVDLLNAYFSGVNATLEKLAQGVDQMAGDIGFIRAFLENEAGPDQSFFINEEKKPVVLDFETYLETQTSWEDSL